MGKNEMKIHLNGYWVYIPVLPKIIPVKRTLRSKTTVVDQTTPVSSIAPAKVIKPVVKPSVKPIEPKIPTHKTTEESSEFNFF
jgi:hypothetical protein